MDDDLLARSYESRAFLPNAVERSVELLFRLDSVGEVATDADRDEALDARVTAYTLAFRALVKTPGWPEIDEDQQRRLAEPFERGQKRDRDSVPIPQLRADRDACDGRLRAAVAELRHTIDGERLVMVSVGSYFADGIETKEQLDAALDGIREECSRLIGAGKKVVVQ